ncbi:RNA recognition motif domain containing protein [Theileria equi strain WA]|uniref:RNA recognition motif domain containing protein n=1 Tax=Theileria equi strain WA TaxID=1537102 RepID=L1LD28_THEEQ|nr:RNA recognition motif domain containing protein [Theileria equi strain WA]EKX73241.1 RNA recognition motif domain containing protein [Theileria equi strain WA]|eukprot:XP_004832693.1 RNA recognition motif domain containing protein [Theileria equi strain WA]
MDSTYETKNHNAEDSEAYKENTHTSGRYSVERHYRDQRSYSRSPRRSRDRRRHRTRSTSSKYRNRHHRSHGRRRSYRRSYSDDSDDSRDRRRRKSRRYSRSSSREYRRRDRKRSVDDSQSSDRGDRYSRHRDVEKKTREQENVVEDPEVVRRRELELKRRKEIEEAQRADLTVLVINLSLSADERDIYELFSEHAGKVRDIQCVRDLRSGKSKGIAYVEFYTQESVIKALSMTGLDLKGQRIKIQSSQAEKNRAAKAAKMLQQTAMDASDSPFTIYVGGLIGALSALNEVELKQLFSPFGTIIDVEIFRDPETGESKGYAFLKFRRSSEAKEAMNTMNGFDIGGQQIKVGYANLNTTDSKSRLSSLGDVDIERLDDDGGGLISGATNKIALMEKLQRTTAAPISATFSSGKASGPTSNIILSNMFTANDPGADEPNFFVEIEEDVKEECEKYGKVVAVYLNKKTIDGKVWVKFQNSTDASTAYKGLNGRYFAGNTIKVEYVTDDFWRQHIH